MSDDRVLPRARLPSWRQPVAFPWMGAQGLEAAPGRAHAATACRPPVSPGRTRPTPGQPTGPTDAAAGWQLLQRALPPSSAGPGGRERSRSASDGHMMPAPGACAPSGPQGLFSGGSCIARASATAVASSSFLRPLGNALRIFSAPRHHEATSAMPFLARQGPRPLPLVSRVPSGFEAGRLGWAQSAACPMRPWALRGAGPGCESRAACRCRGPGAACPFPAAGLEVGVNPACLPAPLLPQRREFS